MVLGAAVIVPLLGRHSGLDPKSSSPPSSQGTSWIPDQVRDDGRWRRALAAYEAADAELRAFERRTAGAAWEEQDRVEQGMNARLDLLYPTLRRLLRVPAPDLPALAAKIALVVDHEVRTLTGCEACLAALKRDAWRLAGD